MSKAEWLKQRTYRIGVPDSIKLGLKNIKVIVNGDKAVANVQMPQAALADFGQEYENSWGTGMRLRQSHLLSATYLTPLTFKRSLGKA